MVGNTFADVQEGSKMPGMTVWAKEHYDWSAPELITWTVRESNFCAPGSYVLARSAPEKTAAAGSTWFGTARRPRSADAWPPC
jgi:hypothetical protein